MLDILEIKNSKAYGKNTEFLPIEEYYTIAKKLFYRIGRKYGLSMSKRHNNNDSDVLTNMVELLVRADSDHDPSKNASAKTLRYVYCRNYLSNYLKKVCRKPFLHINLNDNNLESEEFLFKQKCYFDETKETKQRELITACSKRLNDKQKLLLKRYYEDKKTLKEIGIEDGVTQQAIHLALQKTLKIMRETGASLC